MCQILQKILITWITVVIHTITPALACTLWAANGKPVENGRSLMVKNRDWAPDHRQELKYVKPADGYKYIGLFAADGEYSGLKAGLNEKGLVVISASASSIPLRERKTMPGTHSLLNKLLTKYSSVDEALNQASLFLGPRFLMIANKNKVASIEIGPGGVLAVQVQENSVIYHTNHYVGEQMSQYNQYIGKSSKLRYERIGELLSGSTLPYNLDTFITFSHDRNAGDDNSIFRQSFRFLPFRSDGSFNTESGIPIIIGKI